MELPTLPIVFPGDSEVAVSLFGIVILGFLTGVVLSGLVGTIMDKVFGVKDGHILAVVLPVMFLVPIIAGFAFAPSLNAQHEQAQASAMGKVHEFQGEAKRVYGVLLSSGQAKKMLTAKGQEIAPGIKQYGHTIVRVNGELLDVGLYKRNGIGLLLDRSKLATGVQAAALPKVMR